MPKGEGYPPNPSPMVVIIKDGPSPLGMLAGKDKKKKPKGDLGQFLTEAASRVRGEKEDG